MLVSNFSNSINKYFSCAYIVLFLTLNKLRTSLLRFPVAQAEATKESTLALRNSVINK
jgi:hypothetical protein